MFYLAVILLTIVIGFISTMLARKYPTKKTYLLPGVLLTTVAIIPVIVTFFIGKDSWSNMGYSILFFFVAIASIVGTAAGKIIGGKT